MNKLNLLVLLMLLLMLMVPITYSKFQSNPSTNIEVLTAFYLLDTKYQTANIKLDSIVPSETEYNYDFSVANYDENRRCETDMEYEMIISATTNLPLEYRLYEKINNNYNLMPLTDDVVVDDDGTYFKEIRTEMYEFTHNSDQKRQFRLGIYFPTSYASTDFQGIIEGVMLKINSRQKIEENND